MASFGPAGNYAEGYAIGASGFMYARGYTRAIRYAPQNPEAA